MAGGYKAGCSSKAGPRCTEQHEGQDQGDLARHAGLARPPDQRKADLHTSHQPSVPPRSSSHRQAVPRPHMPCYSCFLSTPYDKHRPGEKKSTYSGRRLPSSRPAITFFARAGPQFAASKSLSQIPDSSRLGNAQECYTYTRNFPVPLAAVATHLHSHTTLRI